MKRDSENREQGDICLAKNASWYAATCSGKVRETHGKRPAHHCQPCRSPNQGALPGRRSLEPGSAKHSRGRCTRPPTSSVPMPAEKTVSVQVQSQLRRMQALVLLPGVPASAQKWPGNKEWGRSPPDGIVRHSNNARLCIAAPPQIMHKISFIFPSAKSLLFMGGGGISLHSDNKNSPFYMYIFSLNLVLIKTKPPFNSHNVAPRYTFGLRAPFQNLSLCK